MIMGHKKDPVDIVTTIRQSIEVSQRGARRVRCHRLRDLFGFQAWNDQRRHRVATLLEDQGIVAQPKITDAGLGDWIVLSLPVPAPPSPVNPDPRPTAAWFEHIMSVRLDSEREVEFHFAGPLFHAFGYTDGQEAAGFRFDTWAGVHHQVAEADLLYFADERRSLADGQPLVLVETKAPDQACYAGTGQARSYALWIMPAYYVTTNGDVLVVHDYQGAAAPDVTVLEIGRSELRERFDELYHLLSPKAAAKARVLKTARLTGPSRVPASPR
jgi:hypothetical protein